MTTETDYQPKPQPETLNAFIDAAGLTIHASFVPFSSSRNAKPDPKISDLSLNWRVTVKHDGREILTTDYQQGVAFAPSYKRGARPTLDYFAQLHAEAERGRAGFSKRIAPPTAADVFYALSMDSDALEYASFEEWASELGYDTDSREAEGIYRACLDIALKLRAGGVDLDALRAASEDF